jgi:hypothetical protein
VGADVADGLIAVFRRPRVTGRQLGQPPEPDLSGIDAVQRLVGLPDQEVEAALLHRPLDLADLGLELRDRGAQRLEGGIRLLVGLSFHHVAETDKAQRPTQKHGDLC